MELNDNLCIFIWKLLFESREYFQHMDVPTDFKWSIFHKFSDGSAVVRCILSGLVNNCWIINEGCPKVMNPHLNQSQKSSSVLRQHIYFCTGYEVNFVWLKVISSLKYPLDWRLRYLLMHWSSVYFWNRRHFSSIRLTFLLFQNTDIFAGNQLGNSGKTWSLGSLGHVDWNIRTALKHSTWN